MASDYTYEGIQNNQYTFRNRHNGQTMYLYTNGSNAQPELMDGDEVALPRSDFSNEVDVHSLLQQRIVRSERR